MTPTLRAAAAAAIAVLAVCPLATADDAAGSFARQVAPILSARCGKCHGRDKPEAMLTLTGTHSRQQLIDGGENWWRVLAQIEAGLMPPEGSAPLTAAERKTIADWVRGDLTALLAAERLRTGRARFRRLTRFEYANTVEDLFGIRPRVDLHLPEDGRVDGFDKVSPALPLSADGTLGYLAIADELVGKWILQPLPKGYDASPAGRTVRAEAVESGESPGHTLVLPDGTKVSFNSDRTSGRLRYPGTRIPGRYKIRVSVFGYQTDKPLPFGIFVGKTEAYPPEMELAEVLEAPPGKPTVLETTITLRQGSGIRLIPFGLGVQVPKNTQASRCKGPGLAVQWLEAEAPELPLVGDKWVSADLPAALVEELRSPRPVYLSKVVVKGNKLPQAKSVNREEFLSLMRKTFARVGARLFRRDLSVAELDGVLAGITTRLDRDAPVDAAFREALVELLTAPEFLCVIEEPGRLSDFALASRLSYFLWGSTPDEALLELARAARLRDPQVLAEQTERLLRDERSERFLADFSDQWLGLRAIDDTSPDHRLYPEYAANELLKPSSVRETRAFLRAMVAENLSVRHFVDSPWTLANEALAKHYGLPDVTGTALRKVALPAGSPFGGLWTQSAVLKVTANGSNTSPVKRGVWVAERLLGVRIPPPPPNIEPADPDTRGAKTLREQLALHSRSPSCGSCHARFDAYGFALESFDVTGRYRQHYRELDAELTKLPPQQRHGKPLWRDGLPVDATGTTPTGRKFADVRELRALLAAEPRQLAVGVTRHLLTYSTGAPATELDMPAVERIVAAAAARGYGLRDVILALVQSDSFRSK